MATFGVPRAGPDDATRALRCTEQMIAALHRWNERRVEAGFPPLDVRIGAHYGSVVLGAVGSERSLSIAVVGDTVNIASRLQVMGRESYAGAGFGAAAREGARQDGNAPPLAGAIVHGPVDIRGREEPVHSWTLPRETAVDTSKVEPMARA